MIYLWLQGEHSVTYWLGECVLTVANECTRRATARCGECASASASGDEKCRPIGFGPQFIVELWLLNALKDPQSVGIQKIRDSYGASEPMLRALQFEGVECNLEETYRIALFNVIRDGVLESVGWLGKMQQLLVLRFVMSRVIRL